MTVVPPKVVPPKVAPKKPPAALDAKNTPELAIKKPVKRKRGFFSGDVVNVDFVANEDIESDRHKRLHNFLHWQTIILAVLTVLLILVQPILKPIYHYYARDPEGNLTTLNALTMPNITDRALFHGQ